MDDIALASEDEGEDKKKKKRGRKKKVQVDAAASVAEIVEPAIVEPTVLQRLYEVVVKPEGITREDAINVFDTNYRINLYTGEWITHSYFVRVNEDKSLTVFDN